MEANSNDSVCVANEDELWSELQDAWDRLNNDEYLVKTSVCVLPIDLMTLAGRFD